ncbi:MAG TPA: hypothetical protein VNS34_06765 [Rhizobiaceae bacterium]|nr:hypothetical protein [Rhizobiaceae bacterium]
MAAAKCDANSTSGYEFRRALSIVESFTALSCQNRRMRAKASLPWAAVEPTKGGKKCTD